jgi:hypothetical protein
MILVGKSDEAFRHAHEFSHFRFQIAKRGIGGFRHGQQPFSQPSVVGRSRLGCGVRGVSICSLPLFYYVK